MAQVTAREAEREFSALLNRVVAGEQVTITREGTVVALLSPAHHTIEDTRQVIAVLRELRRGIRLGNVNLQDLIAEGRGE